MQFSQSFTSCEDALNYRFFVFAMLIIASSEQMTDRPTVAMVSSALSRKNVSSVDQSQASMLASVTAAGGDRRTSSKNKDRKNRNRVAAREDRDCGERTEAELREMLGPAFNGRYMSVERPAAEVPLAKDGQPQSPDGIMADGSSMPDSAKILPFHVDPNYTRELPANFFFDSSWYQQVVEVLPTSAGRLLRWIRGAVTRELEVAVSTNSLPWQCESQIIWADLGANYYPRFMRSVRCTRDNCWFGHFRCRPKAFTVNVLKRVRDSCKEGSASREWIYEERAVTFCCECAEH